MFPDEVAAILAFKVATVHADEMAAVLAQEVAAIMAEEVIDELVDEVASVQAQEAAAALADDGLIHFMRLKFPILESSNVLFQSFFWDTLLQPLY